ncbi:SufE family protein [Nesterenkonia massiliensis]|uniref:SufE family protein n=1 Tax=Nesterenkonia massiliensis TaxID=1232429 RepID=A0ABT2HR16_9MICC|nr:SufE family protein [Nesterenkonia massiliensis]MCT1607124.1 SufE family protein [Nesterenkonia massiliensis]
MTQTADLPEQLAEIVEEFAAVPDQQKLELLLELSRELPELPAKYQENYTDSMEQVVECQSPLFLAMEYDDAAGTAELIFSAPAEAPTTRGFASILQQGLSGLSYQEILSTPDDLHQRLGLGKAITPLRLRGMSAMLGRVKRNIREHLAK